MCGAIFVHPMRKKCAKRTVPLERHSRAQDEIFVWEISKNKIINGPAQEILQCKKRSGNIPTKKLLHL